MYLLATWVLKSGDSTKRKKNSYTSCKWGHAISKTGSSSSASAPSAMVLIWGDIDRKVLTAN